MIKNNEPVFIYVTREWLDNQISAVYDYPVSFTVTRTNNDQAAVAWMDKANPDAYSSVYVGLDETAFIYGAATDIATLLKYNGDIWHIITVESATN